jgi:hypothetical protein
MLSFVNLDGVKAQIPEETVNRLKSFNYSDQILLRGKVGCSELGMFTGKAECVGVVAFSNSTRTYAHVLLDDNTILDGSFTLQDDFSFSLS